MATITTIQCDVCKATDEVACRNNIPVVFITDQTDGCRISPYMLVMPVDLCPDCESHMVQNREILTASGAQGHNKFWFARKHD